MSLEIEAADKRRPFRFAIRLAVFAGLIYLIGRLAVEKKNEYYGLTESEAREKFIDKMSVRVGDETAEEIADRVIPKLKERGLVKPDPGEQVADAVGDAVDSVIRK